MEKILDVTTVTPKYQVTITKAVRDKFNIEIGNRLVFMEKNGELIIRKA